MKNIVTLELDVLPNPPSMDSQRSTVTGSWKEGMGSGPRDVGSVLGDVDTVRVGGELVTSEVAEDGAKESPLLGFKSLSLLDGLEELSYDGVAERFKEGDTER